MLFLQCGSLLLTPGGGSRQRSSMSAMESKPDGRWMRSEPPFSTRDQTNIIGTNSGRRVPRTPSDFPRTNYFRSSIDCLTGTFHCFSRPPLTRVEAMPARLPRVITSRLKIYEHTLELCRCRWRRQLGFRNNSPLSWRSLNTNGKSFPA